MIKAYVKNGIITLKENGEERAVFLAGTALTTFEDTKGVHTPYSLFPDYEKSAFQVFVHEILDKLFDIGVDTPERLIAALDQDSPKKIFESNSFNMSIETIDDEAVFVFFLSSAKELFALELLCAIQNKKPLKKCVNCGNYFFPTGRSDARYCDRIGKDGFSCKKIGANRQYRKNQSGTAATKQYEKVTKHNRYLKNKGVLTESDFTRWMNEAAAMYARFKNGEISENYMLDWLSAEVNPSPAPRKNDISDYLL